MARFETLVHEMTAIAQRPQGTNQLALEELQEEFYEYVLKANKRLAEVRSKLSKGLRAEAVSYSQQGEDLLELAGTLDFPYLPHWNELCLRFGVSVAPQLDRETASDLNHAHAAELPLANLMRQHRLAALAKAPASIRLLILRQIQGKDLNNPSWKMDIEVLEKVRLRQLDKEIREASEQRDLNAISSLHKELNNTKWINEVPPETIAETARVHQTLRRAFLCEEYERVLVQSEISAAQKEVAKVRDLVSHANNLLMQIQPPLEGELIYRLVDCQDLIDRDDERIDAENEFQMALNSLNNKLDHDISSADNLLKFKSVIERSMARAESFDLAVPEPIVARTRAKIIEIDKAMKRSFWQKISAISFACIVLLGLVSGGVYWYAENTNQNNLIAQFKGYYESENYDLYVSEYEKLLDNGDKYVLHPEIKAGFNDANAKLQKDKNDRFRISEMVKQIDTFRGDKDETKALQELTALNEQYQVADASRAISDFALRRETWLQMKDDRIRKDYEKLYAEIREASLALQGKSFLAADEDIKLLKGRLGNLIISFPNHAQEQVIEADISALTDFMAKNKTLRRAQEKIEQVTGTIGAVPQFVASLEDLQTYLRENQGEQQRIDDIDWVLNESNYWAGVSEWTSFYRNVFQPELIVLASLKEAEDMIKDVNEKGRELVKEYPELALKQHFLDRESIMAKMRIRSQIMEAETRSKIRDIIYTKAQAVLKIKEDGDDLTYYLPQLKPWPPSELINDEFLKFDYVINKNGEFKSTGKRVDDIVFYGEYSGPTLVNDVQLQLSRPVREPWELGFVRAVDSLLNVQRKLFTNRVPDRPDEATPPSSISILHCINEIMDDLMDGSPFVSDLEMAYNELQQANVDTSVNLLNPEERNKVALEVNEADKQLETFRTEFNNVRSTIGVKINDFKTIPKRNVEWVGWIDLKDPAKPIDGYKVNFKPSATRKGQAFIIIPEDDEFDKAKIQVIGEVLNGGLDIPPNNQRSNFKHRVGRPVFVYLEDEELEKETE